MEKFDLLIYLVGSVHKCGKIWKRKDRANILRHLESCHVSSKCLFHSRSPCSKNVIGGIRFHICSSEAIKQQKKTKKILTIKLNLSSNLVIEFHAGGARFEITTAVLLFVVKNDIKALFFLKQARTASKSGAHYTRVNTVYNLYFKESEGLVVEFV